MRGFAELLPLVSRSCLGPRVDIAAPSPFHQRPSSMCYGLAMYLRPVQSLQLQVPGYVLYADLATLPRLPSIAVLWIG